MRAHVRPRGPSTSSEQGGGGVGGRAGAQGERRGVLGDLFASGDLPLLSLRITSPQIEFSTYASREAKAHGVKTDARFHPHALFAAALIIASTSRTAR